MDNHLLLLLMGVLLFGGILSGAPVSFVLIGVPTLIAFLGAALDIFDLAFIDAFPSRAFGLLTNPILVSVPLFILMGGIMEKSEISRKMMLMAGSLFGNIRGGMAYSVIIVGALLAASTGVIGATIFMLGLIALPAMLGANYSSRLSSGVICASGSLGQIIPPSILLILLADQISSAYQSGRRLAGDWVAEPVSVGDLFAGALLPGLLLVGLYILYVFVISIVRPNTCPPVKLTDENGLVIRPKGKEVLATLIAPLTLIVLVLGAILGGIATPTESAALGAAGALMMVALGNKKSMRWCKKWYIAVIICAVILIVFRLFFRDSDNSLLKAAVYPVFFILSGGIVLAVIQESVKGDLLSVSKKTALMVSMLTLIVLGATMLSLVFRGLGGEKLIHETLSNMPGGVPMSLFLVMLTVFFLGFIIEYVEIIFIVVPIAAPPLFASDVNPVWLAILISMNLQMSFLTPPFGYALFYFRNVAPDSIKTVEIYKSIFPFILLQLVALGLVAMYPIITTWLPDLIYN